MTAILIAIFILLVSIPIYSLYLMIRHGRGTGLRGSRKQYAGFRLPYYLKANTLGQVEQVNLRNDESEG